MRHDDMVYAFGSASFRGSRAGARGAASVVALTSTPGGSGYWLVDGAGGVFNFGAPSYGSSTHIRLAQPVVGIASTPTGHGYWLAARDGGVFSFGDAAFYGSLSGTRLSAPIIAIVAPRRGGYWLVGSDGGVFSFGPARFLGSLAGARLNAPVSAMSATPSGLGYWLAARDGGVFSFGDAHFAGSTFRLPRRAAVTGIANAATSRGYWLAADDGSVFRFGSARFEGSAAGLIRSSSRVVGIAGMPMGDGYRLLALSESSAPGPSASVRQAVAPSLRNLSALPSMPAASTAPPPPPRVTQFGGGVIAIGDSVMIDAQPSLLATIPGISVNATVSRQASEGIAILSSLASSGSLPRAVVWHLGTNGTLSAGEIAQVIQIAAGRRVVMLTDHCPYCSWTAGNNAAIYAGCSTAQNCSVADWNALANANPGWFGADGVHMAIGGAGANAYAQLVAAHL
jgi:hypothetical protein